MPTPKTNKTPLKRKPSRNKNKTNKISRIFKVLAIPSIIFALFLLAWMIKIFFIDYSAPCCSVDNVSLNITPELSAKKIGEMLESSKIITSSQSFHYNVSLRNKSHKLKFGEYEFKRGDTLKQIIDKIENGNIVYHSITIPEGLASREIKALLEKENKLTGEITVPLPEGSILPDTYHFKRGETKNDVICFMKRNFDKRIQPLWINRQKNIPIRTLEEALIVASIVEEETYKSSEKPYVASVYYNRLKRSMRLQADPTVRYAIEQKANKRLNRFLKIKDLKFSSPFNTYRNKGLPPTPICHFAIDTLEAVLQPAQTNYLYFVADGSGGHIFSATYAQHKQAQKKWRRSKKKYKFKKRV